MRGVEVCQRKMPYLATLPEDVQVPKGVEVPRMFIPAGGGSFMRRVVRDISSAVYIRNVIARYFYRRGLFDQ
jgi:hypothetical protein